MNIFEYHLTEIKNLILLKKNNLKLDYIDNFKGVNLEVKKGVVISIVGASGAGKTTLLQILGTLDDADQGELIINKQAINKLKDNSLSSFRNQYIGFVFQFHNLLAEFTALENICLPAIYSRY